MRQRKGNLTHQDRKYAILQYLLLQGDPRNEHNILSNCLKNHTLNPKDIKDDLRELCEKGVLERIPISESRFVFRFTEKGDKKARIMFESEIKPFIEIFLNIHNSNQSII